MITPRPSATLAPDEPDDGVRCILGLVYGSGLVGSGSPGGPRDRALKLDLYEPAGRNADPRPCVVLAFGGAFHRGSREDDTVVELGHSNSPIAAYCRMLARHGYVAASIDYRLVPEDPVPGDTPVIADPSAIPTSRVAVVRRIMGLPPATSEMLWRGIESASDDMAAAFRFLSEGGARWRIDPRRIAVGGFSAGARTALNAAYGERVGAAAVVSLSGYMATDDLARHVTGRADEPPALLITGENDLGYVRDQAGIMAQRFASVGTPAEAGEVPGGSHFYPMDAQLGDGRRIDKAILAFLDRHLHLDRARDETGG